MKNIRQSLASMVLCAVFSTTAWGAEPVRQALSIGDYTAAQTQAEQLGTADGFALAAEAILTEVMLGQAESNKKQSKKARELAEAALSLDSAHQNARLQYAIADGFVTRETGDMSAWMKKLPQKTYAIAQAYRTDFPDDPRGDALLGAWHLAVVRKAGDGNARKWFDASVADGVDLFNSALTAAPQDPTIAVNYAFALIALDEEDMPDLGIAKTWLERSVAMPGEDHLTLTMKRYAAEALLRLEDRKVARKYVDDFLDGKNPAE